eukprot:g15036.t1
MGRVYIVMDKPDKAIEAVDEAREIADRLGDKRWSAKLLFGAIETLDKTIGLAQAAGDMQDADTDLRPMLLAKQAQEFFQESYWPRGEAQCLHFMADLRGQAGDLDQALECAEERLAVLRGVHDLSMEANAMMQLAQLHMKDTDKSLKPVIDRAVRTVNEALQVAGKAENRSLRALVLFKRAETMVLAGRHQTGLRDVKEAAAIFEEMDHYQALGRCMLLSGNIKHALGQVEQGEADVEKADLIAKDIGDHQLADEVLSFRKALEEKKKEQERAAQAQIEQPQLVAPAPGQPAAAAPVVESVAAPPEQKGLDPVYVRKQLAAMVKDAIASDEELELDSPFMDAGMDSLSSVALMSMVAKDWENRVQRKEEKQGRTFGVA